MKLKGKVAVITGSGQGIGEAIARKFAGEGASVVVNARHAEGIGRVAQEIEKQGGKAVAIVADVSKKADVQVMVKKTLENFGRIDILVNSAGITLPKSILDTSEEDWDSIQDINLKGTFLCTQAVLPSMMKQRYGKIINLSSLSAFPGSTSNITAYSASKGGVISLTKSTAREVGPHGINVNCIAPGLIITDIIYSNRTKEEIRYAIELGERNAVLGRAGKPEDVTGLALFLASDESSFMTGQVIRVDGGRGDLM